jgi:hypothetical protein
MRSNERKKERRTPQNRSFYSSARQPTRDVAGLALAQLEALAARLPSAELSEAIRKVRKWQATLCTGAREIS